jgi:hypothetical protein
VISGGRAYFTTASGQCARCGCWAVVECFLDINILSKNLLASVDFQVSDLWERGMASTALSSPSGDADYGFLSGPIVQTVGYCRSPAATRTSGSSLPQLE